MKTTLNANFLALGLSSKDPIYSKLDLLQFGECYYEVSHGLPSVRPLPVHWNETALELLRTGKQSGLPGLCAAFETFGRCLVPDDLLAIWLAGEVRNNFDYRDNSAILFDPMLCYFQRPNFRKSAVFLGIQKMESVLKVSKTTKTELLFEKGEWKTESFPSADPSTCLYRLINTKKNASFRKNKIFKVKKDHWRELAGIATLLQSASLLGVATRTLEMASEHAKTRVVSGSPIGRYQAISHSLADMLVAVEKLRSIIIFAAESHGTQDFEAAVSMAKSTANRAAVDNTQRAIQIFGAKGFQWSFPLNFFLRRSLVGSALFGSTRDHNSHFVSQVTRRQLHGAKLNQDAPSILHLASIAESEKGVSNVSKEVFQ